MKLHLGCGSKNFGFDWVHIDGGDYDHLDYHDVTKLEFHDNSVDLIYASHIFEYFDRIEVILVLKEWFRVLKPNGTLRLAVPDFESLVTLYKNSIIKLEQALGPLYGKMKMCDNTIYHKTAYDFTSLKTLLESCSFTGVKKYDWRKTEHANFDDFSQAYIPHMDKENGVLVSLNVECNK